MNSEGKKVEGKKVEEAGSEIRSAGRPRSAEVDNGILEAVLDIIAEQGLAAVCIEGIAARAGVGKASIYRRFDSKEELIVSALVHMREQHPRVSDRGSVRERLVSLLDALRHSLADTRDGRIMLAVLSSGQDNPQLSSLVYERIVKFRRSTVEAIVLEGMSAGEFVHHDNVESVVSALVGSSIYLAMWSSLDAPGGTSTEDVVELVLGKSSG